MENCNEDPSSTYIYEFMVISLKLALLIVH